MKKKESILTRAFRSKGIRVTVFAVVLTALLAIIPFALRSEAEEKELIDSGTSGTCSWEIDKDGKLTIFPTNGVSGVLERKTYPNSARIDYGWNSIPDKFDPGATYQKYYNVITSVYVEEGVSIVGPADHLFCELKVCESMDLRNLDLSACTDFNNMFNGCLQVESILMPEKMPVNFSGSIAYMYCHCSKLKTIDVSWLKGARPTYWSDLFYACESLEEIIGLECLDTSHIDTPHDRVYDFMFFNCKSLKRIDVSNLYIYNAYSIDEMFYGCSSLEELDFRNWYPHEDTGVWYTLTGCRSLIKYQMNAQWRFPGYSLHDKASPEINFVDVTDDGLYYRPSSTGEYEVESAVIHDGNNNHAVNLALYPSTYPYFTGDMTATVIFGKPKVVTFMDSDDDSTIGIFKGAVDGLAVTPPEITSGKKLLYWATEKNGTTRVDLSSYSAEMDSDMVVWGVFDKEDTVTVTVETIGSGTATPAYSVIGKGAGVDITITPTIIDGEEKSSLVEVKVNGTVIDLAQLTDSGDSKVLSLTNIQEDTLVVVTFKGVPLSLQLVLSAYDHVPSGYTIPGNPNSTIHTMTVEYGTELEVEVVPTNNPRDYVETVEMHFPSNSESYNYTDEIADPVSKYTKNGHDTFTFTITESGTIVFQLHADHYDELPKAWLVDDDGIIYSGDPVEFGASSSGVHELGPTRLDRCYIPSAWYHVTAGNPPAGEWTGEWRPVGDYTDSFIQTEPGNYVLTIKFDQLFYVSNSTENWTDNSSWSDTFTNSSHGTLAPYYIELPYTIVERPYTVHFEANGGEGEMEDQLIPCDVETPLNKNEFTREDYTFLGWSTDPDAAEETYADQEAVLNLAGPGEEITLYAIWEYDGYIVHFDANGGEGEMEDQYFLYDEVKALSANEFTREGHAFMGWSTDPDATIQQYLDKQRVKNLTTGKEITLYAVWAETQVKFKSTRVVWSNSLRMEYYFPLDAVEDWTGYYVHVVRAYSDGRPNVSFDIPFEEWTIKSGKYCVGYDDFAAKEMNDEITLVIYNAEGKPISKPVSEGIKSYAMRGFEYATSDLERTALVEMLNYGAQMQLYKGYRIDDLATNKFTDEHWKYVIKEDPEMNTVLEYEKGKYAKSILITESNIKYRMFFRGITPDMTAKVELKDHWGGTVVTEYTGSDFVQSGDLYYFDVESMVVADARCPFTATIYNADGSVYTTCTDSIESYCLRAIKADPAFEDMAKATLTFCDAVYAYLHRND